MVWFILICISPLLGWVVAAGRLESEAQSTDHSAVYSRKEKNLPVEETGRREVADEAGDVRLDEMLAIRTARSPLISLSDDDATATRLWWGLVPSLAWQGGSLPGHHAYRMIIILSKGQHGMAIKLIVIQGINSVQ